MRNLVTDCYVCRLGQHWETVLCASVTCSRYPMFHQRMNAQSIEHRRRLRHQCLDYMS